MEVAVSVLKNLTFVAAPKRQNDPIAMRRNKLMLQLQQQREAIDNPNHVVITQRWLKSEDGSKRLVERQRRVKRWWQVSATGECVMTVRYGARVIEFQKGLAGIAVGKIDNLAATIDALIAATEAGELDAAIAGTQRTTKRVQTRAKSV